MSASRRRCGNITRSVWATPRRSRATNATSSCCRWSRPTHLVSQAARAANGRRTTSPHPAPRTRCGSSTRSPPDRLKNEDLRFNLLAYMENPPAALASSDDIGEVSSEIPQKPFESLFEQHVYLRLKGRGYHVIPQYPAGGKRIDLVVVGARGRLAVECDGERYHSTPEQSRHDQQGDREHQRVGWTFWRIRESELRLDPDEALPDLWEELNRLGIRPVTFGGPDE